MDSMRIKYQHYHIVDGDTIKVLWGGLGWSIRIYGLDTDEINGSQYRRGVDQKTILIKFFSKIMRPRLYALISESREGWPQIKTDGYGRWLCCVRVWSWKRFRYMDYSRYMVDTGNVKKGSKWNL